MQSVRDAETDKGSNTVGIVDSLAEKRAAMTEQQQRAASAELARRMGWTDIQWLSGCQQGRLQSFRIEPIPDYFTDAAASWELRLWLASDDARWQDFAHALYEALGRPQPHLFADGGFYASLKPYLTAEPSVIARAACKALGIEVSE